MYSIPVIVAPAAAVATGSCQTRVRLRELSGLGGGEGLGDLGRGALGRGDDAVVAHRPLHRRASSAAAARPLRLRRVVQVGGDLRLADRDPRRLRGGRWCLCLGISLIASPPIGGGLGFVKQLTGRREPTAVSCLMQPSVRRSHRAAPRLSRPGLLDRQVAGGDRRALVAADRPRRDATATAASARCRARSAIARNVLSARLQRLVDEDILERRAYQESPPRYEYFLTEKGLDLWPALIALLNWGDRYSPGPEGPPTADRPQGVRRRRQRARHLRTLRQRC